MPKHRGDFYPISDPRRIPDSMPLRRVKLSGCEVFKITPSSVMLYHRLKITFPDVYTSWKNDSSSKCCEINSLASPSRTLLLSTSILEPF